MDLKRFGIGTLAGGVTDFLVGYTLWVVIFGNMFKANLGSATGVEKVPPDMVMIFVASLMTGALVTYIFDNWAGIKTFATGAKAGAIVLFLVGAGHSILQYATTNIMNMNGMFLNLVCYTVLGAIVGGVVGLVLGKIK